MALVVQISSFEELQEIIENSGKEYDREKIEAAYRLAEEKHREQKRSSGEPYIIHPRRWRPSWLALAWTPSRWPRPSSTTWWRIPPAPPRRRSRSAFGQ